MGNRLDHASFVHLINGVYNMNCCVCCVIYMLGE